MNAILNKKLNPELAIHAIIQSLRFTKRKTTKITPSEAHFGGQFNAPISNNTTKSINKILNYNKMI